MRDANTNWTSGIAILTIGSIECCMMASWPIIIWHTSSGNRRSLEAVFVMSTISKGVVNDHSANRTEEL